MRDCDASVLITMFPRFDIVKSNRLDTAPSSLRTSFTRANAPSITEIADWAPADVPTEIADIALRPELAVAAAVK